MKEGTKVFDIRYGWGDSYENKHDSRVKYPIGVNFKELQITYKAKGKEFDDGIKWLSLTEYSLEKGGFTPIDSEPPLVVGDMVYVWDSKYTDKWLVYGKISSLDSKQTYPFKIGNGSWLHAFKEIPQWFIDKNI